MHIRWSIAYIIYAYTYSKSYTKGKESFKFLRCFMRRMVLSAWDCESLFFIYCRFLVSSKKWFSFLLILYVKHESFWMKNKPKSKTYWLVVWWAERRLDRGHYAIPICILHIVKNQFVWKHFSYGVCMHKWAYNNFRRYLHSHIKHLIEFHRYTARIDYFKQLRLDSSVEVQLILDI